MYRIVIIQLATCVILRIDMGIQDHDCSCQQAKYAWEKH